MFLHLSIYTDSAFVPVVFFINTAYFLLSFETVYTFYIISRAVDFLSFHFHRSSSLSHSLSLSGKKFFFASCARLSLIFSSICECDFYFSDTRYAIVYDSFGQIRITTFKHLKCFLNHFLHMVLIRSLSNGHACAHVLRLQTKAISFMCISALILRS